MNDISRSKYQTFETASKIAEGVVIIMISIGALLTLIGFVTGGIGGMLGREPPIGLRFIAALPGIGTMIVGLFFMVAIQYYRAGVDNARMTAELLYIARKQNPEIAESFQIDNRNNVEIPGRKAEQGGENWDKIIGDNEFFIYKGKRIIFKDGNCYVEPNLNQPYLNREIAQAAIDRGDV